MSAYALFYFALLLLSFSDCASAIPAGPSDSPDLSHLWQDVPMTSIDDLTRHPSHSDSQHHYDHYDPPLQTHHMSPPSETYGTPLDFNELHFVDPDPLAQIQRGGQNGDEMIGEAWVGNKWKVHHLTNINAGAGRHEDHFDPTYVSSNSEEHQLASLGELRSSTEHQQHLARLKFEKAVEESRKEKSLRLAHARGELFIPPFRQTEKEEPISRGPGRPSFGLTPEEKLRRKRQSRKESKRRCQQRAREMMQDVQGQQSIAPREVLRRERIKAGRQRRGKSLNELSKETGLTQHSILCDERWKGKSHTSGSQHGPKLGQYAVQASSAAGSSANEAEEEYDSNHPAQHLDSTLSASDEWHSDDN